jgi:hypothetical protein
VTKVRHTGLAGELYIIRCEIAGAVRVLPIVLNRNVRDRDDSGDARSVAGIVLNFHV